MARKKVAYTAAGAQVVAKKKSRAAATFLKGGKASKRAPALRGALAIAPKSKLMKGGRKPK